MPIKDAERGCRLSYTVSAPPLKEGRNFIEVAAKHGQVPSSVVEISGISLKVEYHL